MFYACFITFSSLRGTTLQYTVRIHKSAAFGDVSCEPAAYKVQPRPSVEGLTPVCTSLQYARDFTYKIAIFVNFLNHEIYINLNEILKLGYMRLA